jgi:hypothetical protein
MSRVLADVEKLQQAKKSSRGEEHTTVVLTQTIPGRKEEDKPYYEAREFFRYSRGKLDIYDRIGKGFGQVKLSDEEMDFLKLMEDPPTADFCSTEDASSLLLCGIRLRQRKRRNVSPG